jgi:MarR family transcriptional regulator, 2-MHQ and catechol-resistance regulon repressor
MYPEVPTPYTQVSDLHMKVIRSLAEAYYSFNLVSSRNIESLGLTAPQFDVLATLYDTEGLTCKQISSGTLVTKGTLTGIIDRLIDKNLVYREKGRIDARQVIIRLTPEGLSLIEKVFSPQIEHLKSHMNHLSPQDMTEMIQSFYKLRDCFKS